MAVLVVLAHPAIIGSVASASDESDWFDAGDRADIAEFGDDPTSKELDYASATLVGPFEFNSKTYYVAQYDGAAPSRFELDIERAKYSKDLLNDVNIEFIPRVKFFKKENGDLISISDPNRELVNTILRTNKARFHAQTKPSVNTPLNRELVDFQKNAISGLSSKITFPKQELSKLTKEKRDRYFAALKLMTKRGTESIIPDEYEKRIKENVKDTSTLAGYADQTASLASELSKRQATLNDAAARRNMKLAAKALRKSSDVYENLAKRIKISEYSKSGDQVTAALSIFDLVIRLSESTVYADAKVKRLNRIQEYAASTEGVSLDSGLSDGIERIDALNTDASAPEIAKDIEFWIKESVAGELGTYAAEKALKKFVTWKFSQTAASTALVAVAAADVGLTAGGLLTGKNKVWKRFTHAKYSRLAMMEFREVRKHIEKSKRESHLTGERAEAYYSAVYFEYESRAKFYEQMESGLQGTKVDDVLDFIQDRRGEEIAGKLAEDARNNTGLVGYVPTNKIIGKTPTRPTLTAPADGASGVSTGIVLKWSEVDAAKYRIQLEAGDQTPDETLRLVDGAKTKITQQLIPDTTYYWQVIAVGSDGKEIKGKSRIRSFTTAGTPTELPSPSLSAPRGVVDSTQEVTLQWNDVESGSGSEDDVTYDVYLGTGTDNPRTIVSEDISGTQTTVSVDPGGSYSWKVIAHRGQQQSSSTVGSFSVSSKDISADKFSPVQPTNGRQDTGFGVTLKWNAPEPDRYANNYVYLDTDPTTQDGDVIHDSRRESTEIDNLDPDTTYYWQVVVVNNGKRTAGPVWSFSTAPKTGSLTLSGVRLEEDEELVIDGEAGNDHTSRTRLSYYVTAEEIRSESGGEYDIRVIDQQTGVVLGTDESNTDDEGDRIEVELELHDESLFKTPGERQLKLIAKHHASGDEVTTTTSVNVELESPEDQATILPERPTVEDEVTIDVSEMSEIGSQIVLNPDEYRWLVSHDETDNVKVDTNGQEEVSFQPEDETEDLFEEYRYALKDTEEVRNPYIVEDDVFVVDENTYEPDMEVGDLSVSKNVVEGTPVEASIKLTNDGRAKANYIIRWKVDGQIVDSAADSVIRRDDEDDDLQEDTENEQFSLRPGDHQITAVVIDARGKKHKRTQSVTVAENNAPSLSSPSPAPGESLSNSDQTLSWEATDANGDDLRYNVSLDAGDSTPDKRVATNINTQSIDPGTLNDGTTYYWQVTATDEHGRTNTGPVWSFSTSDEDDAPVSPPDELTASAGPDQTVTAGKTVEIDASGSTAPDNSALSYRFQQVSRSGSGSPLDVSLQDPETRTPEFTAPDVDSETTVTFELTVTNSAGTTTTDTDTDRVNITVKPSDPTSDQPLYTAGFESTPSGETPSDWTASGNSAIRVSNAQAADGTKSLRLSGSSGGCLETVGFGNLGQDSLFTQSTAGSVSFSDRFDDGTLNSQWEGAGINDPQVTESDGTLSHAVDFNYGSDNNRLQTTQTFDTTGTHRIEMRVRTTQSDYWGYGVALDGTNGKVNLKEHKWERFNRFVVSGVTDRPDKYSSDYKYYGEQTHKAKLADATSETSFITYSLTVNFDTQTVTEVRRGSETWETDLQIKDIGDSYQLRLPTGAGHDVEYDAIAVGPADGDWSLFNDAANEQMPTPTSTSSSQSMNISFSVRPGGQAQTGCHDHNTAVNLNTGNDGTYGGKNIKLIEFTPDGSVEATFGENTPLGSYDVGTWTDVRVKYTPLKEGQARVAYFIDGEQREIITRGEPSFADQLSYLQVNTGEYTTYVDDINLTTASSGVGDGDVDNPLPTTSLRFTDQTISSGSATLSVDTAQFGNQTVPGEKFVVVVHKTTESTYDDEIGPKVGESDVLSPGTQQSVEVDLSRTLGPSDDIAELTKSQSLVAMLHRADTDDGDNINHGSHITRNGDKVTSRAQVTVSSPPDKPGPGAAWTIYPRLSVVSADIDSDDREELGVGNSDGYGPARYGVIQQGNWIWNTTSSASVNAKTTADTDGDGSPEILFGARASSTWVRSYGSAPASRWSVTHGDWVDGSQRADTDGDGRDEVAVVSGNRGDLTVIDDGRVQWQPQSPANIEGLFGLTEVTGDDTPEILTHSPPNDDKQGLQLITKSDTGGVEVVWRAEPNAPVRATLSELDSDTDASEEVIAAYPGRGLITSLDAETGEMRWREQVEVASGVG